MTIDREMLLRIARNTAVAVFILLVPVFLITTNVRWVINAPFLYSYGFDKYRIEDYTGIEKDQLMLAAQQIRDYFNNDDEFIQVQVRMSGVVVPNLFNEREILHMRDVKSLVRGVYTLQWVSGLYILAACALGFYMLRRSFWRLLGRWLSWGGGLTLSIVLLAGAASVVGFDRVFLAFHLVSFSNDLWQLDPRRDYLIAMFPQGFFFDATLLIALSTIVASALLVVVPIALRRLMTEPQSRAARRHPTRS